MATERKIGLGAFYNMVQAPRGISLAPHHYPLVAGIEDPRIGQFLTLCPPGAGKSALLSSIYPAWEIGHDPALTVMSISAGEDLPKGFMATTMQIIQHDKNWASLFPDVRPHPELGWSLQRGLFVTGHHPSDPDASYKAFGLGSKMLTGAHARLHIYDDIHDEENAATPEQRAQVVRRYYSLIAGRGDPQGTRRIAVGRWWAQDDVYQEWISSGDWVVMQLPAVRDGVRRPYYDVFVPRGLDCVFTETLKPEANQDPESAYVRYRAPFAAFDQTGMGFYWPGSPEKRKEYAAVARRQPRTAAIGYRGDMSGGGDAVFDEEDFVPFVPPDGLSAGVASPAVTRWIKEMRGDVEDAWDTALGQPQSESLTAALTGLLVPCREWHCGEDPEIVGRCDFHYDVYLLDLMVKDLDFRQLTMALRERFGLWHPRRVNVEEKQSGVGLLQVFKGTHVPVHGLKVAQGKLERAVNAVLTGENGLPIPGGAASVQGWARMGRIRIPGGAEWLTRGPDGKRDTGFLAKVCAFKGGTKATDEFDALVHLVTRAIVKSRATGRFGSLGDAPGASDEASAVLAATGEDPRRLNLEAISEAGDPAFARENPMHGLCMAPCQHYGVVSNREWCGLHARPTTSISGCSGWTEKKRTAA